MQDKEIMIRNKNTSVKNKEKVLWQLSAALSKKSAGLFLPPLCKTTSDLVICRELLAKQIVPLVFWYFKYFNSKWKKFFF